MNVWVGLLGAVALSVAGCGGGTACGDGTIEMDGECVPESMLRCGPGTMENADGACVPVDGPEVVTCGAGTTLDTATGECEPDVECGTGTTAMAGECVPDGSVICDDGTMFDATTGTCVGLDGTGLCADGTTLIDGECVPNDDTLMGEVFAAAEPDDPAFDGTPGSFIPPALGAERTLEGCITARDFDTDGVTDSDLDYFGFSTAGPGLFRINADGLGGLAAGFLVIADDGPLADQGWYRFGLNYGGDTSERRVYLPRGGNYHLVVFDTRSYNVLAGDWVHPVGNDDTCYFVTVEAETIPAATPITTGTATGTLGDPQFYTVTPAERRILQGRLFEDAPNAIAGVVASIGDTVSSGFVDAVGDGVPDQALVFSGIADAGQPVLFVIDEVLSVTPDPVTWRLDVAGIGQVPDDGTIPLNNDPDDFPFAQFGFIEVTAGEVLHIDLESDELDSLGVRLFNPDLSAAGTVCAATPGCDNADVYFAVDQTGAVLVQFINGTAADDADYNVTFDIQRQTPPTLNTATPAAITLADTRTFVRVNTSSQEWTRYALSAFMGTGFTVATVAIHPDAPGILVNPATDRETGVASWIGRIPGLTFGAPLLIELADASGFDGDESVTLEFRDETYQDLTLSAATPHTGTAVVIPATATTDGWLRYFVRGQPGGELTFTVTGTGGTDPSLALLDARHRGAPVINATGANGSETFVRRVPSSGWFAFGVTAVGGAAGTVDVSVTQLPPPYLVGPGTTTFSSICPSSGGSGTVVTLNEAEPPLTPADEGLSGVIALTTFTGFEFFGAPVTSYQISSNGFLSFSTTPLEFASFVGQPLGTATGPNAVVAPFWRDLVSEEICLQQEAGRFVVEMNGTGYDFFVNDAPYGVLQMQVIMTASTGSIEFVYGAAHDLAVIGPEGFTATMGLENQDGTVGVPAGLPPTAGTSILFVPGT